MEAGSFGSRTFENPVNLARMEPKRKGELNGRPGWKPFYRQHLRLRPRVPGDEGAETASGERILQGKFMPRPIRNYQAGHTARNVT
jgi:hypothetical protein